jgi:ComF family protein
LQLEDKGPMQEPRGAARSRVLTAATGLLRAGADGLLTITIAPRCAACDSRLDTALSSVVCGRCWGGIRRLAPPFCDRCGGPLAAWRATSLERRTCARCRRRPGFVLRIAAAGEHEGALRAIIHAWKYGGRRTLGSDLAALLLRAGGDVLAGADAVVPVPLHPRRRRSRGFNQADDLASRLGLPVARVLRRRRPTPSQVDLPSARRHANVRGAFVLARAWAGPPPAARVAGRRLVLVDDVATTGATLEACARVLLDAGAGEVSALTLARAVDRRR